jgi:hypothetical protein
MVRYSKTPVDPSKGKIVIPCSLRPFCASPAPCNTLTSLPTSLLPFLQHPKRAAPTSACTSRIPSKLPPRSEACRSTPQRGAAASWPCTYIARSLLTALQVLERRHCTQGYRALHPLQCRCWPQGSGCQARLHQGTLATEVRYTLLPKSP